MPKAPNPPRGSHRSSPVPSGSHAGKKPDDEDEIEIYEVSPAAGLLPVKLDYTHKAWLNEFIPEFNAKRAKRGCRKDNATTWTCDFFVNRFLSHFFSDVDLTAGDKKWLCDTLGEKVYNFFGNCAKRRTSAKPPKTIVRTKRFAQDAYRQAHPEEHDAALQTLLAKESPELVGTKLSLGQLRHYSCLIFKQLSAEDQRHWKQVAKDELAAEQEASRLTDPLACDRYVTGLIKTLQQLIVEAGRKANVRISMQLVAEESDCRFKLSNLVSSNLGDFGRSDSLAALLHALKDHIEKTVEGGTVEGDTPERDIIIGKNGRPLLPEITGMDLPRLRRLARSWLKLKYAEEGGVGKVPFEEIGRSLPEWFDPERLPPDFVWMDPGSMTLANVLVLFDWILRVQSGDLGLERMPQFLKVNAGPNPIDASASQETSREQVHCKGQDIYFLRFDETVTKCHAVNGVEGMGYSKSSIAYTLWRQTGNLDAAKTTSSVTSLAPAPPAQWLDLPFGADIPRTAIFGAEKETLITLAPLLPREHRERLENVVRLVNEHQAHLPASNERGPWAAPVNPPNIIPPHPCRSPPNPLFAPIWAICYFKIPSSMEETIFHVEVWLESILKSGVLVHEPSGTLFGGDTGVVWVVRVLIIVFLNFVAVKYNVQFPGDIPAECDLSRLPLGEWPRVLNQLDSWAQRLRDSIAILQRTSEARTLGLHSADDDDDDIQLYEPIPHETTVEFSSPAKRPRLSKKSKQKFERLGGSESEGSLESEDSSSEDEDMDFNAMDKKKGQDSDDDEGDGDEGKGDEEKDKEEDEYVGHRNTAGLFDSSGEGDSRRSTPAPSSAITSGAQKSIEARVPAPTLPTLRPGKSTSRVAPWKRRTHAFGPFIVLDQRRITTPKNVGLALDVLDMSVHTWKTAANELKMLSDLYTKPLDIDPDLLAAAQHGPAPLLSEYILCRQAIWKRTESLSQSLFEIGTRIFESFTTAFRSFLVINRMINLLEIRDEARDDCRPEIDRLQTRVETTGKTLTEARWTWVELQEFESKATNYLNKLQGNWLAEPIPTDLADLHRLVLSQIEWADDFSKAKPAQVTQRQIIWKKTVPSEPFPAKHLSSGMRFAFGNPTGDEEPSGLRDALAQAAQDLAGPSTSAQIVSKPNSAAMTNTDTVKDVTMTDAPSSAPATQQNPTLEQSDTIVQDSTRESCASPTGATLPIAPSLSVEITSPAEITSSVETISPIGTTSSLVASAAPVTPAVADAADAAVAPFAATTSPAPDPAADTVPPCSPTVRSTSSPAPPPAGEHIPQEPAGRKQPARKSNGLGDTVRRTSSRHTAIPDVVTEPRQTRASTTRASAQAKHSAEAAQEPVGRRGRRKLKGSK